MSDSIPPFISQPSIEDPRPWAFTKAELTAGLRRYTGNPTIVVTEISDAEITQRRPAFGKIRGLDVKTESGQGEGEFTLVLKESRGISRAGTAGAGLREVSFYRVLSDHVPVHTPKVLAAHPHGNWLILERLPYGKRQEKWQAADYLLAIDQIAVLHDRFWGLGEDLAVYSWLARPIGPDLQIHKQAAIQGVKKLTALSPGTMLSQDEELSKALPDLLNNMEKIGEHLRTSPTTLLHGDYWPGNIHINSDATLSVFDWEHSGIGPGILDLVFFVQSSRWYLEPLPIKDEEIVNRYRERIKQATEYTWTQEAWDKDWDYAIMWIFLTQWIDILANIPNSVLTSRLPQMEGLWLTPVRKAAERLLK